MENYGRFFVDFLTPFFEGLISIFKSFFAGIVEMLNIVKYIDIINSYNDTVSIIFIILAVICLILLIVLLLASTYAWFSVQNNVSLTGLLGTVNTVDGLMISLDAKNYKKSDEISKKKS